jgi:hypothetical protein
LEAAPMLDGRRCYMLTCERLGWLAGTIVYDSLECDYGMAGQDTRHSGIEHVFVSIDTELHPETRKTGTLLEILEGLPPNFTVPLKDLMPISDGGAE